MTTDLPSPPAPAIPVPAPAVDLEDAAALRGDIRALGELLGATLVRQDSAELLALVEQVRATARTSPTAVSDLLDTVDLPTAIRLARAFSTYFHLANVTEQVHRSREQKRGPAYGGRPPQRRRTTDRGGAGRRRRHGRRRSRPRSGGSRRDRSSPRTPPRPRGARCCSSCARSPTCSTAPRPTAPASTTRAWPGARRSSSTCCGRPTSCAWTAPRCSTRRATRSTTSTTSPTGRWPRCSTTSRTRSSRSGVTLPADARPLSFGSWIGGDRDGNPFVTPDVTRRVIDLVRDHAVRDLLPDHRRSCSRTSRSASGSTTSRPSCARRWRPTSRTLPDLDPRYRRLNAEEPYRLKLTCVRAKLDNTRARIAAATPHRPGRDYATTRELLDDLMLVRDSLAANRGELAAHGVVERAIRIGRGVRPLAGHARRARARLDAPRRGRRRSSTVSASRAGATRTCRASTGCGCSRRSSRRAARWRPPRRRSRATTCAPTTRSSRSATRSTCTARTCARPTSSR